MNNVSYQLDQLNEKERLLQEVHHRVKNNLQLILSLVDLDSRYHKDNPSAVLQSTQERIYSMALVHELIQNSEDLSHINLKTFISSELNNIFDSYSKNKIYLTQDLDDVNIDMIVAIPISIILRELFNIIISKEINKNDVIKINIFLKEEENVIKLIIEDNGEGFDDDMLHDTSSLSFTILNVLVDQIEGKLTYSNNIKSKFVIEFSAIEWWGDQQDIKKSIPYKSISY